MVLLSWMWTWSLLKRSPGESQVKLYSTNFLNLVCDVTVSFFGGIFLSCLFVYLPFPLLLGSPFLFFLCGVDKNTLFKHDAQ